MMLAEVENVKNSQSDKFLLHHLKLMANAIIGMEQGIKRLDLLEFEILQIKTQFNERIMSIRNNICVLCGYADGGFAS